VQAKCKKPVVLTDRPAGPGLCGAWVVDADTNIVVGIVVAHSKTSPMTWMLPAHAIFADIKHRWATYGFIIHELPHVSQFPEETLPQAPGSDSNQQPPGSDAREMTSSDVDALQARHHTVREAIDQPTLSGLEGKHLATGRSAGHDVFGRSILGHEQTSPSFNTANMPSASQGKDQDERLSTASTLTFNRGNLFSYMRGKHEFQDDRLSTASSLASTRGSYMNATSVDTLLSRHSTSLSNASTLAPMPITPFSGYCKNAYKLRYGSIKSALSRTPVGLYGDAMRYICASTKCRFAGNAIKGNNGWQINDRIQQTPEGLRYRWLFLAKSHMQQQVERQPSFGCLICTGLGNDTGPFEGFELLLVHVAEHKGGFLGKTKLEGLLVFSTQGVRRASEEDFDIDLPKVIDIPEDTDLTKDINFSKDVSKDIDPLQVEQQALKPMSPVLDDVDYDVGDYNPWAS